MKKIILLGLSLLTATGLMTVKAQSPLTFGAKVEANMSNFLLSDMDAVSSTMKLGPTVGGFMNIGLHRNFSIQPEVMFFYRSSKMETEVTGQASLKDDFTQWGMQVPVYFLGHLYTDNGKFYGGCGSLCWTWL